MNAGLHDISAHIQLRIQLQLQFQFMNDLIIMITFIYLRPIIYFCSEDFGFVITILLKRRTV